MIVPLLRLCKYMNTDGCEDVNKWGRFRAYTDVNVVVHQHESGLQEMRIYFFVEM